MEEDLPIDQPEEVTQTESPTPLEDHIDSLLLKSEGPQWARRYHELYQYYRIHGNCRVTEKYNKSLHYFVQDQRKFRRKEKLSASRIAKLDAIGFEWNPNNKYMGTTNLQPV